MAKNKKRKDVVVPDGTTLKTERIYNDDINLLFALNETQVLIKCLTAKGEEYRIAIPAEKWLLMNKRLFKVPLEEPTKEEIQA